MKTDYLLLICLMVSALMLKAEKHGLIIAIGDYPTESEWPDISSTNDVAHVSASYRLLGFKEENIKTIIDTEATYSGILDALKGLNERVAMGDVVFIHYSGHGQQVVDDNGDELDGLDEAIVPYDSPLNFEVGVYEGERLIRDDLIGQLTHEIRRKIGANGQLVLVMDSCHSGTGTRGGAKGKSRGTDKIMAPPSFVPKSRGKAEANMGIIVSDEEVAPMASFFGASARELNYETVDDQYQAVGSLSFAFASTLAKMSQNYSFQEIFERVKLMMKSIAPSQNPQWEGPKDVYLLGSSFDQKEVLYTINEIINSEEIKVNIGTIGEVYEGSIVELFSIDQDKVLATGEIIEAFLTESLVLLDDRVNLPDDELIKVRVVEKSYAPIKCMINLSIDTADSWYAPIAELLDNQLITIADDVADLYLSTEGEVLSMETTDGYVLFEKEYNERRSRRSIYQLQKILRAYTQGKYLRGYDAGHSSLDLEMRIVQVSCDDQDDEIATINDHEIAVGSCIKLEVENVGNAPAYFSVIDIQPDNVVNMIIPATYLGYTAEEYYLGVGDSFTTDYTIEIGEPYGNEVLKLIATDVALDLSAIMSSQGASTRGANSQHPFENIFAATYQSATTRGAVVKKASGEQVGTDTQYFRIVMRE